MSAANNPATATAATSGMSRTTGKVLTDVDHIAQSIGDILSTPLGTRVMRRDYGSLLAQLIDAPMNAATRILCINAVAIAIIRWEPRVTPAQVIFGGTFAQGQASLTLKGSLTGAPPSNSLVTLSIPLA